MGQQSSKSSPTEQKPIGSNGKSSLIAQESDVSKELEIQPEKRRRIIDDEQSMVTYDLEQGSSSNSQLTCPDWLSNNSAVYPKMMNLKRKVDRLFARQHDVLTELEHAELQPGQKRRAEVHHWLTEVQRIKGKIRSRIKDGQRTSSNSNLSGSMESLIAEVDELIERSKFSNGLVLLDQESTRLPLLLDTKPVGTNFQRNTEKIMGWLQNDKHCVIGVYGMGGVGKTTLLRHIHDQLLQDSNLSNNIGRGYWVTVSQNRSVDKLQEDIARVLGLQFRDVDERKRAANLYKRLTKEDRTVLILDDMWEKLSGKVGIPLENSNCKIILSTRSYDVCRKMGCKDFVIKAEILYEEEGWDLFVGKLGHYDTLLEEAKNIAWDIAKECGGLPLALITVGCCMKGITEVCEWENALYELRKPENRQDELEDEVFRILKFSYDRLKDHKVQNCFLSCVLFAEDMKIKDVELVDLWVNEGLLDDMETERDRVNKGHVILNRLVNACLLESSGEDYRWLKMHDLIRDMAIIITRDHPLFIVEARKHLKQVPGEEKWSKDLVKVSLSYNKIKEIPSVMAPRTPNLTVLMLNGNHLLNIPNSFFVHMRSLTHLDLSRTDIKRVPESVCDLENLRGLLLVYCVKLMYVPSVAKLTKLRMLDLDGCYEIKRAPRGLERLKSIEKLSYVPWESHLIGFKKVVKRLTSLSCFRFWIRDTTIDKFPFGDKEFYEYDKAIWVCGGQYGGNNSIIVVPATVESLRIRKSEMEGTGLGDVFQPLGEAKGLIDIEVKDCRGLEYITGSSGIQQGSSLLCNAQLERLVLKKLPDLRSIVKLGAPDCFTQLSVLALDSCPKLKAVVPVPRTKQLLFPNLEVIRVYNCEEVEEIFETMEATLTNPVLSLPNLELLDLAFLPKIKVIFPFAEEFDLPYLENISVWDCEELEEIFETNKQASPSSNPIISLPTLDKLFLSDLPELGSIYRGICHCTSLLNPSQNIKRSTCPKLKWVRLPGGGLTSDESCLAH